MRKVKIKIPAKINLTLDVKGVNGGYHQLKSLVASVNVYDIIIIKKRKDKTITLTETKLKSGCDVKSNNAYKACVAFTDKFGASGVDIVLEKNIPVGAGLGGSSADIAGVLLGMKKLFNPTQDVKALADALGSDSGYMLGGGWAIMSDRGTDVERLNTNVKLYLLVITEKNSISTKECFKLFDDGDKYYEECTDKAVKALLEGDLNAFASLIKNDLLTPSATLLPSISENIKALENTGAIKGLMTGSGSATYGIFMSKKQRNYAYKKLRLDFGDRLIKLETL